MHSCSTLRMWLDFPANKLLQNWHCRTCVHAENVFGHVSKACSLTVNLIDWVVPRWLHASSQMNSVWESKHKTYRLKQNKHTYTWQVAATEPSCCKGQTPVSKQAQTQLTKSQTNMEQREKHNASPCTPSVRQHTNLPPERLCKRATERTQRFDLSEKDSCKE